MTCGAFIANLLQQRCVSLVSCELLEVEKEISAGDLSQVLPVGNTSTSVDMGDSLISFLNSHH